MAKVMTDAERLALSDMIERYGIRHVFEVARYLHTQSHRLCIGCNANRHLLDFVSAQSRICIPCRLREPGYFARAGLREELLRIARERGISIPYHDGTLRQE